MQLTRHCREQAAAKGYTEAQVLDAANNPTTTYESRNHPGQHRHIKGDLCVVVDRARRQVITLYVNVEKTALRPDQLAGKR